MYFTWEKENCFAQTRLTEFQYFFCLLIFKYMFEVDVFTYSFFVLLVYETQLSSINVPESNIIYL